MCLGLIREDPCLFVRTLNAHHGDERRLAAALREPGSHAQFAACDDKGLLGHIQARLKDRWPGLELVTTRYSDGLRDKALTETKNLLRAFPDVQLVMAIAAAADNKYFSTLYARLLDEGKGLDKAVRRRSLARLGRDLRAVGDFIPDQVLFLLRCGFSSFEVGPNFSVEAHRHSVAAYTVWYQRGVERGDVQAHVAAAVVQAAADELVVEDRDHHLAVRSGHRAVDQC